MGCTSSVPNVIEAHTNSTDRTIHFLEDEGFSKSKENESNKENGLSKCDTVNDIQLDRNIFDIHNDSTTIGNVGGDQSKQEDNNQTNGNDSNYREQEKITTLKEVVEHVLSNNDVEKHNIEKISSESNLSQVEVVEDKTDTKVEQNIDEITSVAVPEELKQEVEELASPSQSEGSRATRWEALADMAAELPPSLTVDPITGQIYSLSKQH